METAGGDAALDADEVVLFRAVGPCDPSVQRLRPQPLLVGHGRGLAPRGPMATATATPSIAASAVNFAPRLGLVVQRLEEVHLLGAAEHDVHPLRVDSRWTSIGPASKTTSPFRRPRTTTSRAILVPSFGSCVRKRISCSLAP